MASLARGVPSDRRRRPCGVPVDPICVEVRRQARAALKPRHCNIAEDVGISPIEKPMVATNGPMASNETASRVVSTGGGPQLLAGSTPVFRPSGEYISGGLRALRGGHPELSPGARNTLQGRWSGCRNARFSGVSLHATATSLPPAGTVRSIFIDFPDLVGCPKRGRTAGRPNEYTMPRCGRVNT